jgi:hypothetical protein
MAAVQDSDPVAARADARRRTAFQGLVFLTAAGGLALTLLVFYPGYSTVDARYVYADAQAWRFGDWQSPMMAVLWRLVDPIAPGSSSMFLLTATLYWLGFGLLALVAVRRAAWLGLVTPLLAFAPPAFFFVGMVWRDVLFGVVWLVAPVLALAGAERAARLRLPIQALALLLVALGVLLRPNAIFAARFRRLYRLAHASMSSMAIVFLPAVVLLCACPARYYISRRSAAKSATLDSGFRSRGITHFREKISSVTWMHQTALSHQLRPRAGILLAVPPFSHATAGTPRRCVPARPPRCSLVGALSAHPSPISATRATFMWQFARSNWFCRCGTARSRLELGMKSLLHAAGIAPRHATHLAVSARPLAGPSMVIGASPGERDPVPAGRSP